MVRRNFICPETAQPCKDTRCTVSRCIPADLSRVRERNISSNLAADEVLEIRAAAKAFAINMLKENRLPLTDERVAKLMARPDVQAEAKRRVETNKKAAAAAGDNLDDLFS